jgi:zinc transport system substrate-binding protein
MCNYKYFLAIILFGLSVSARADVPNVVVTLKPVYSLVAGVMSGLKKPTLLYSGKGSPHTQLLTPKEVRQINAAEIVIWIGPSYEASVQGILRSAKKGQSVITLVDKPGIILYPFRQGGMWGYHSHADEQGNCEQGEDCSQHNHDQLMDGHIWLDPENAKAIVKIIANELSMIDPAHEDDYRANADIVLDRLEDLDIEITRIVAPIINKPYVVYHDGTQYFDRHFKTKAIGVLIGDGHFGINAQHLVLISELIRAQKIRCVFTEPQFPTDKIYSLLDKTGTRIETLDYLGVDLEADENAYFLMMRNLAQAFVRGLGGDKNS